MIEPRHFFNCETRGVVYLLMGGCNAFYVGKTRRMLWQRVNDHAADIKDEIPISPVARHFADFQSCNIDTLSFRALDRVHQGPRGGDFENLVLRLESRWIFTLRANHAPGPNGFISYAPFLSY